MNCWGKEKVDMEILEELEKEDKANEERIRWTEEEAYNNSHPILSKKTRKIKSRASGKARKPFKRRMKKL